MVSITKCMNVRLRNNMCADSRSKGSRGNREAKEVLEKLGFEDIEICHIAGRKDKEGGDIYIPSINEYVQVKYGLHVPKVLYKWLEECENLLLRRVGQKKDDQSLPWLRVTKVKIPSKKLSSDLTELE